MIPGLQINNSLAVAVVVKKKNKKGLIKHRLTFESLKFD